MRMKFINKLANWYFTRRALPYWMVLLIDCLICYLSGLFVFWLYYRGAVTLGNLGILSKTILLYMVFNLIGFRLFRTYSGITATSKYDETVSASIHVIVGMLPTIVWDFEDYVDPETGEVTPAQDYYCGEVTDVTVDPNGNIITTYSGILKTSNYGRGGNESIEIASLSNDDPVRFGAHSLKLNFACFDPLNCFIQFLNLFT